MEYTFAQAKRILGSATYLRGTSDVGTMINNAVQALAGLSGWQFMRRLVRTFSASPVFTLPQGTAELVRVCVNGKPASLHPTDYQFLHSGPGDLDRYLARGFRMLGGGDVADLGYSPTQVPVPEPSCLCVVSPYVTVQKDGETRPQAPVTVSGLSVSGERITRKYDVIQGSLYEYPEYSSFDFSTSFAAVDSVVLDEQADEYITLYGMTAHGSMYLLGHYHPEFKVPKFRMYQISGTTRGPYDILAEVRMDPVPCIDDADVVPVPSLEPIKMMMLYDANMAMNEQQTAQGYLQQATQWLSQMQVTDNTVQTPVVQNTLFEGSGGELSEEFRNL